MSCSKTQRACRPSGTGQWENRKQDSSFAQSINEAFATCSKMTAKIGGRTKGTPALEYLSITYGFEGDFPGDENPMVDELEWMTASYQERHRSVKQRGICNMFQDDGQNWRQNQGNASIGSFALGLLDRSVSLLVACRHPFQLVYHGMGSSSAAKKSHRTGSKFVAN
jgi:hypothetical protein